MEIPTDFLNTEEWYKSTEYETAKKALKALSATNDSAERAIALAVTFNTKITRDEQSYQELLQVVEYHRKTYILQVQHQEGSEEVFLIDCVY